MDQEVEEFFVNYHNLEGKKYELWAQRARRRRSGSYARPRKQRSRFPLLAKTESGCDRLRRMRAVVLLGLAFLLTACNAGPHVVVQEEEDTTPALHTGAPAPVWQYKTDGSDSWACAPSVDNAAEICFRRGEGHLDSYLHLPHGGNPFFCQRGRCETKLKLDAAPERIVQGTDDETGGTRILFLGADKLLHEVHQAKQLTVKPPMFGVDQEFVFQVSGLNWEVNDRRSGLSGCQFAASGLIWTSSGSCTSRGPRTATLGSGPRTIATSSQA